PSFIANAASFSPCDASCGTGSTICMPARRSQSRCCGISGMIACAPTRPDRVLPTNEARSRSKALSAGQCAAWIALLACVLWLSLRGWGDFQVGAFQDDAIYLVLARSLAAGHEYGLINQPHPRPLPKFPFGFPLALASFGSIGTQAPSATIVPLVAT